MKLTVKTLTIICAGICSAASAQLSLANPLKPAAENIAVSVVDPGIGTSRADPLAVIDQNRQQVVNRIMTDHSADIQGALAKHPGTNIDDFRGILQSLRADRLLAASLSNSFSGITSLISQQMGADSALDRAKTLGSASNDWVYTPITPCRLLDTRGSFSPQYAGGAFAAGATRTYNVRGPANTGCAMPTRVRAVILQAIAITPPGAGDLEILKQGATFGNTVAMVFQANVFSSVSIVVPTNAVAAEDQISVQIRGTSANLALDIVGYYAENQSSKLDCFYTAEATQVGLNNGSFATLATDRCDSSILSLFSYRAVSVNCKTQGSPYGSLGEHYTEVDSTPGAPPLNLFTSGERGVCHFINTSGTNSGNTYSASAKCCRIPGR
jgi:hypothetical protein